MAHRTWASASFNEKYQCPELAAAKLPISPSTHTQSKWLSSRRFASRFKSLTESEGGLGDS